MLSFCILHFALCILATGCGPSADEVRAHRAVSMYFAGDYPGATRELRPLAQKTDEDFVLNNCRLGTAALADYNLDEAQDALLRAYEVINSVGVNDGGRSLGATVVSEKLKIWKGEPFERAMANFYLGLIYYMQCDYNNARAAFENALFKLRDYGEGTEKQDKYRRVESNFALGFLMLGKCYQRLGKDELARANFERAVQLHRWLQPVADYRRNLESNVLLVVDYGHGPRKVRRADGAFVGFGPTPAQAGPIPAPQVFVDGRPFPLYGMDGPTIDLLALAQDRKWQSIDTIRAVKDVLGTGLIAAGAIDAANDRHGRRAATDLALIGAGVLLKASSQADVRQWETLPRTMFLVPLKLSPGRHDVTVTFPGSSVPLSQTWRGLVVPPEGEATYYYHMQSSHAGPFTWPPPAMAIKQSPAVSTGGAAAPPSPSQQAPPPPPVEELPPKR